MASDVELELFRDQSRSRNLFGRWVDRADQGRALASLIEDVRLACDADLRPVVCIDLDLTTLLAPVKSIEVLRQLAPAASQLPVSQSNTAMIPLLEAIWLGNQSALLPGYTTTAIAGYGVFLTACLEERTGIVLGDARKAFEGWIAASVHRLLRDGYWDRDAADDLHSPGFSRYASALTEAGATIVFLSNRSAALRKISLTSIAGLLAGAAPVFAFFGPGGSQFDASSKAAAVRLIEAGVGTGVYLGRAVGSETVFDDLPTDGTAVRNQTILAVFDDRAENRSQIVNAATSSAKRLSARALHLPYGIACAAPRFCPEVEIVSASAAVSAFETGIEA